MQIHVRLKQVWGRGYFEPKNEFAKTLCRLMRRKVFEKKQLEDLKSVGIEIVIKEGEKDAD